MTSKRQAHKNSRQPNQNSQANRQADHQSPQPSRNNTKTLAIIIGATVAGIVIIGLIAYFIMNRNVSKMTCKSDLGDITIKYNEKTLTGYYASKIKYDFDGQKAIADKIGVETYLQEFDNWFADKAGGTCQREE